MTESISGYRAREIAGLMWPCDERVASPTEVATKRIHNWYLDASIEFGERVHGANSREHDFVMMVDDEGASRGMPWNPRAQFLSGYPLAAPICGNALFFSEGFVDDGMDIMGLKPTAERWLLDPARAQEFDVWLHDPMNRDYIMEYRMRFPQLPPKY